MEDLKTPGCSGAGLAGPESGGGATGGLGDIVFGGMDGCSGFGVVGGVKEGADVPDNGFLISPVGKFGGKDAPPMGWELPVGDCPAGGVLMGGLKGLDPLRGGVKDGGLVDPRTGGLISSAI